MSRGELIVEDNQVKPTAAKASAGTWTHEFQEQHPGSWALEFTDGEVCFYNHYLLDSALLSLLMYVAWTNFLITTL